MDLVQFLALVRRYWLPILICLAAGGGGGYYVGHHGHPVYQARARTLLLVANPTAVPVGQAVQDVVLTNNQIATFASVATSKAVAQRVIDTLGLTNVSAEAVAGKLSASPETGTSIIDITASGTTPAEAQLLANTTAEQLGNEIRSIETGVSDQIATHLLDPANAPAKPVSPSPHLDLVVGLLLGLLAGLGLATTLAAVDRTIKFVTQANAALGVPLLGLIPRRRGRALVVGGKSDRREGEAYRSLRTAVRFIKPDRPIHSLLVTSAEPGDGKTTTAANLAAAIAVSGERVIVVDGDLRRAKLAATFGLERAVGLTSLVLGTATLDDALQAHSDTLKVLPSGPLPPNPSEILSSQLFNDVLAQLGRIADFVIIDAPPVLPVTDAVALAAQVDGVLIVAKHGATSRHAAAEARRKLDSVGANVIGYVLNAVPAREARSYYARYDYDTDGSPAQLERRHHALH